MATGDSTADSHNARIKVAFQLVFQVPFWGLVLLGVATLGDTDAARAADASERWALIVGLAEITFGLIAAGFGACAGFLEDSEEAEDLRTQRRALLLGACALVAAGSALILLSLAGPERVVPAAIGVAGALVLTVLATLFVAVRWQRLDELNRSVARDAGHLALICLSWFGGTWAMLAHVGLLASPAALDWLTMIHGFGFVAGLIAFARKGGFAILPAGSRHAS